MRHLINGCHNFSGVIIVFPGDVSNKIFCIALMIFVKGLQIYSCNGL